jgi:hypothetical protein
MSASFVVRALTLAIVLCASVVPAHAAPLRDVPVDGPLSLQVTRPEPERAPIGRRIGIGLAGAFAAFLAHEAGHVTVNLLTGNVPHFDGLLVGGFVPFFAISPDLYCDHDHPHCYKRNGETYHAGLRGRFSIVTAGFNVQHLTNEIILSLHPQIRYQEAPFKKGMLLFNVFLSWFYSIGAWSRLEDPHGDLIGASRASGINEGVLSAFLLAPAILDTYRYIFPAQRWAPWASRTMKVAFIGLTFGF